MSKTTGALIVTHNSAAWISLCLERISHFCPKVHILDNSSADESAALARAHEGVGCTESSRNLGFAGGVNRGVLALGTDRILVLNPDVLVDTPLHELDIALDKPGVGAVAGLLVDAQGRPQQGFSVRRFPTTAALVFELLGINRLWPSNPVNRHYRCLDLDLRNPQAVEQPAGAFVMFRREAWEQIGGWDESFYPVWFEDVDFFMRLKQAGWRTMLVPSVRGVHAGGHSVNRLSPASRRSYWYGSLMRYSAKHLGPLRTRVVAGAVILGAAARILHERLFRGASGREVSREYDTVFRLAANVLVRGEVGAAGGIREAGVSAGGPEESNKGLRTRHLHGL